jgi:2'-5' RNA ligase
VKLFVAVTPKNLKENSRLKSVYPKIRRTLGDREEPVRFTPPNMWHVTVSFLGEMESSDCDRVIGALEGWTPSKKSELEFHGLGGFPDAAAGRVLWVGVRENKAFLELQSSLENELLALKLLRQPSQEFHPHLTLVRFRHTRNLQPLIQLAAKIDFGREPIEDLILFESVTQGQIPKYIPRYVKRL